jgi:hypothetical protein
LNNQNISLKPLDKQLISFQLKLKEAAGSHGLLLFPCLCAIIKKGAGEKRGFHAEAMKNTLPLSTILKS